MLRFLHGQADVLLCTTIIESGLDIPRANTILDRPRRHVRPRAALPAARPRRPQQPPRLRLPAGPRTGQPLARRAQAPRGDPGSLRARQRLPAREPRPRDPRRRQPARRRAVGQPRRGRLRDLHGDARGDDRRAARRARARRRSTRRSACRCRRGCPRSTSTDVAQRLVLYKRLAALPRRRRGRPHPRRDPRPLRPAAAERRRTCSQVIRLKIEARRLGVACVDLANGEFVLTAAPQHARRPRAAAAPADPGRAAACASRRATRSSRRRRAPPTPPKLFDAARALLAQLGA